VRSDDERINKILEVLLEYVQKDFSKVIPVSDNGDVIDAISVGLNTLSEEIQAYIREAEKQENKLKNLNFRLEQKVFERTEEIIRNEKIFRALIESSNDGMGLYNEKGEAIYVSPSSTKIDGFTSEDLIGKTGMGEVHPDDKPVAMKLIESVFKNPGMQVFSEHRIRHKKGHWVWTEGTITNLLHDSAIKAIVVNFRDITSRKLSHGKSDNDPGH